MALRTFLPQQGCIVQHPSENYQNADFIRGRAIVQYLQPKRIGAPSTKSLFAEAPLRELRQRQVSCYQSRLWC